MSNKLHIRTGDTVIVLSGKDKGKKGKVISAMPSDGKVIVEGISMASRHTKPRKQGQQGGILKRETPVYACKLMVVCAKCGEAARTGKKVLESGEKIRYCKKCGEMLGD